MSGEDNAQSAICFAARSAARREETNRARGNGRQGRLRAPCVARAHALPTRADPRGAPSDMLSDPRLRQGIPFCAGWRRS